MRHIGILISILILTMIACQSTGTNVPAATIPASTQEAVTSTESTSTPSAAEIFTDTPAAPVKGVIQVDTLEQEVYPFVENGKCSLAEAIFAANAGKPQDSCAAGVVGETVIELMPGEYVFTQRDQTPPQYEWLISLVDVGTALPALAFPLTIHGNGSTLTRDESAEPFRFFELMVNSKLTMDNITIQNGDVEDDWGGAIYSMSASITLDNTRFINNHSDNGGAIYFTLGRIEITDSEFIGNTTTGNGGALFIDSSKSIIKSTRFEGNESDGNGGGLFTETVTLVIIDGFFIKNRVTGDGNGIRGGGMYTSHVNLTVTDSQFYQNEAPSFGGAIGVNNPVLAGIDPEDGDPIEQIQESPYTSSMLTSIPGFQATLEAHPSGVFVDFQEDAQIHNNCFANNITTDPKDPNWTSGLFGRASVGDGNYWGDSSGPAGMGPGTGDSVGKRLTFAPFLTEAPSFCDPTLSDQQVEND
ncbi:MAG: hypothetical protein H7Y59_04440 [Anaerolineales bacterium]|nr:hypothetical protein [Anaerolineales bacterium]